MINHIGKIIDDTLEDIKGGSYTPSTHHIFDVAEDATKLYQSDEDLSHHFVAQLLYISKRARPGIHPVVSFLRTRVRRPGTDE